MLLALKDMLGARKAKELFEALKIIKGLKNHSLVTDAAAVVQSYCGNL